MKTYAFIFARGGSKGLLDKNIKKINNKSLIAITIELALKIKKIDKIFVSSDSRKILNIAKTYNVNLIKRPESLSTDKVAEWDAWKHAIRHLLRKKDFFKTFISLSCTAPLRSIKDINACLKFFDKNKIDILYTMNKSNRNPYFNMVEKKENQIKILLKNKKNIIRRQDAPKIYDLNTVAVVSTVSHVLTSKNQFEGFVSGIEIPIERSLDIDTEYDFNLAKLIINNTL